MELLDRLAPLEEPEAGAAIAGMLASEGISVHTGAQITQVARDGDRGVAAVVRHYDGSTEELRAERLLVATGRRPVADGLGLEAVGVKVGERGQVVVDEQLRTHNPRIWAAGDVIGAPQFVYVAAAHGALVADNALDQAGRTLDYRHLPRVIFTSPQLAAVDLTDAQAAQWGIGCACRVLPLEHVPRALVDRDTRGLVKLVAERASGRVLGVTMVAHGAANAILSAVYAVKLGMTVGDLGALPDHRRGRQARCPGLHPRPHQALLLRRLTRGGTQAMDPTVERLLRQRAAAGLQTPAQRRQGLPAPIRKLHRRILAHFAATSQAPPPATLAAWAAELDVGLQDALGRLVDADLVEADPGSGRLAVAYPFVDSPRGYQVRLPGGCTVQAYCAVDALAIPAMLDQDATIGSHDPLIGVPITVEVRGGQARWEPAGVVVGYLIDRQPRMGPAGQAACCGCPLINFHASP